MRLTPLLSTILCFFALWGVGCGGDDPRRGDEDIDTQPEVEDTATGAFSVDPSLPQTCDEVLLYAELGQATTVGCEFYGAPLPTGLHMKKYTLAAANAHFSEEARVRIFGNEIKWIGGGDGEVEIEWKELARGTLGPLEAKYFDMPWNSAILDYYYGSPIGAKGAFKIVSDVPIVAYQYHPIGTNIGASSDASSLLPTTSWATEYQMVGYRSVDALQAGFDQDFYLGFALVVASKDGTEVTVHPSVPLRLNNGTASSGTFDVTLNESDVLTLYGDVIGDSISGTRIESNEDHPIAVFTGHECAFVPTWAQACDHLEEQLPGIKYWGKRFVAARLPNRNQTTYSDPVLWQIAALEDGTVVEFEAWDPVKGLPEGNRLSLGRGEVAELMVYGSQGTPGDFYMESNKAIGVLQYMTGMGTTRDADSNPIALGDPSVAYVPAVEQFLSRYLVHIPDNWDQSFLVITRAAGKDVYLNGLAVDDAIFKPVADIAWEVGRLPIEDGSHIVEAANADERIGLVVTGLHESKSYAFGGGMGFEPLYTGPE